MRQQRTPWDDDRYLRKSKSQENYRQMVPYIGLIYRDTLSGMLNMKSLNRKQLLRTALLIAAMVLTLLAAVYLNLWLFDGCPDIQRIRDLPEWQQTFLDVTFWPAVASLLIAELLIYRRQTKTAPL